MYSRFLRHVLVQLFALLLIGLSASCGEQSTQIGAVDGSDNVDNFASSLRAPPDNKSLVFRSSGNRQLDVPEPQTGNFIFRLLDSDVLATTTAIKERISAFMMPSISAINEITNLPEHDLYVTFTGCGVANAFYSSSQSETFICMELLEEAFSAFFNLLDKDQSSAELLAEQFLVFATYHELAHALADQLHLPIAGNAESAADAIASVFSVERGLGRNVLYAAYLFTQSVDGSFGDIHPGGTDRAGDLICWALGGEPSLAESKSGASLAQDFIASGRDCIGEYQQQLSAVSSWFPRLANIPSDPRFAATTVKPSNLALHSRMQRGMSPGSNDGKAAAQTEQTNPRVPFTSPAANNTISNEVLAEIMVRLGLPLTVL